MNRSVNYIILATFFISLFMISSCKKEDVDTEKPIINNEFSGAFPVSCDTIYFDQDFHVKLKFTDNVELGSYSISIHNNFDHHSHSTDVATCELDPVKVPVNPYTFIQDYSIPAGQTEYETDVILNIPSTNTSGQYDPGDYHFFVSLTDREGWSAQMGVSVKIINE